MEYVYLKLLYAKLPEKIHVVPSKKKKKICVTKGQKFKN